MKEKITINGHIHTICECGHYETDKNGNCVACGKKKKEYLSHQNIYPPKPAEFCICKEPNRSVYPPEEFCWTCHKPIKPAQKPKIEEIMNYPEEMKLSQQQINHKNLINKINELVQAVNELYEEFDLAPELTVKKAAKIAKRFFKNPPTNIVDSDLDSGLLNEKEKKVAVNELYERFDRASEVIKRKEDNEKKDRRLHPGRHQNTT